MHSNNFWSQEVDFWFHQLNSSKEGLSKKQVNDFQMRRIKKKSFFDTQFFINLKLFFSQLYNPLVLILLASIGISALLGDISNFLIVAIILLITSFIGFYEERKARDAVDKINLNVKRFTNVIREGKEEIVDSSSLFPGDIILLKAGDIVPADCLLIEENDLNMNESNLTGESRNIDKEICVLPENTELNKRVNSIFDETAVISGTCKAIVISTGDQTISGQLKLNSKQIVVTKFEKDIKEFGILITKIAIILSILIVIISVFRGRTIYESFVFALALSIGMSPELLPAITTVAMSTGASRLLKKGIVVKKLNAIQNLGEVNLLCTDKTGTITEGEVSITGFVNWKGDDFEKSKNFALLNAINEAGYTNPIDDKLRTLAEEIKFECGNFQKYFEIPYNFERKKITVALKISEEYLLISKGSYSEILNICTSLEIEDGKIGNIDSYKKDICNYIEKIGDDGVRVIAIAYKSSNKLIAKDEEEGMIFLGFILIQDTLKEGLVESLAKLKDLSVKLKIISGDNVNVSKYIASQIGIVNPKILSGRELFSMSESEILPVIDSIDIFAEVDPNQKSNIVSLLRKTNTVAYMGDGINDLGSLNAADVGISVANASDIIKSEADFLISSKNLDVVSDAIVEGRKTFENTMKYIHISTGSTFGNMISLGIASFFLPFIPMLPIQLLLTDLLTDVPYLMISTDDVDNEVLKVPSKWDISALRKYIIYFGIHSSFFDLLLFAVLYLVLSSSIIEFQSTWFILSIFTELLILFIIRSNKLFIQSKKNWGMILVSTFSLASAIFLLAGPYSDLFGLQLLEFELWIVVLFILILYSLSAEILKRKLLEYIE